MFIEKLKELKKDRKIASFYTNENNTSKFIVGSVVDFNDDYFIISMISPQGLNDGLVLKETSSIIRINTDSMYENKILALANYHKIKYCDIILNGNNLIFELLSLAKMKNYIITIELLNSGFNDVQGYVGSIENDSCNIKQITEYGDLDGIDLIKISDITEISCNSDDDRIIEILYSIKSTKSN
ncbi:MAG: hypothetical protein WCR27_07615 [Eubacteriales bacterium]